MPTITNEKTDLYDYLVENNQYGELLALIAEDFNLDGFKKVFDAINTIHEVEGHIINDVHALRKRFRNEMLSTLGFILPSQDYEIISKYI